jgi:predicted dehydrogenase
MKIKHAIIGCGHIAPSHVDACISNGVEIGSCFDLDQEKARKFASTHHIKLVASSLDEIISDNSINTVSVCTDHKSHAELAIKLLKSGKNVVVEKPMALDINSAKEMITTAKKFKKILSVISQHRYNQVVKDVKCSLDKGDFGKITLINATLNCQKDNEYYTNSYWKGRRNLEGGSTLINQAIHTLDLVLWIKKVLPIDVKSYGSTLKFKNIIETEDTFSSIMRFQDESLVSLSSTNTSVDTWDSKIEIIGTKGTVTFSADYPVKIIHLIHENFKKGEVLRKKFESGEDKFEKAPPVSYYGTKHREQLKDFFNVVCGNRKKLFMPPEDALKTLTVVLKLYQYR